MMSFNFLYTFALDVCKLEFKKICINPFKWGIRFTLITELITEFKSATVFHFSKYFSYSMSFISFVELFVKF